MKFCGIFWIFVKFNISNVEILQFIEIFSQSIIPKITI